MGVDYHVGDILLEFLGHNFVSGLLSLKPKKPKNIFLKNLAFYQPWSVCCLV